MVSVSILVTMLNRGISGFQASDNRYTVHRVANPIPFYRCFLAVLVYLAVFSGQNGVFAQQSEIKRTPAVPVKLSEIPERFFQVQDNLGFFWQSFGNGALVSGDTQYLQSGLNLIIDGAPLKPSEVLLREPGDGVERIDLQFIEKRAENVITRDLWFDLDRSAVRVMDTLSNSTKSEKTVVVSLRTTYPFSWQSLHGSGGALLPASPGLNLNPGDYSLGVHFNPSEGRHDTFFILGSEKGGQKPELKASPNSRELTFTYNLILPPGESRSLVHWIMQRNLPDVSNDNSAISPFFQRGRLVQPGIEPAVFPRVVNFDQTAFQAEPVATAQLKSLVALNVLMDRFGSHRRSEDLLWVSPTNQVSGTVGREGALTVASLPGGDKEVKITDIAAIRGSAGSRQNSLVYLRNGRVLSGTISKGSISWSVAGAPGSAAVPGESLDPNSLNLLLLATGPSDGVPPPNTSHFLQLTNGSVVPLDGGSGTVLNCSTPWGSRRILLSDVIEMAHTLPPHPHFRLLLKNGASFTAFLAEGSTSFQPPGGESFEVAPALIDRIWTAGATKLLADSFSETWLDFSELPSGVGPAEGFLLSGNTLIDGGFADDTLFLSDRGGLLEVETAQIKVMRRSGEPGTAQLLEIELLSGNKVVGELSDNEVRISSKDGEVIVPADQVFAYQSKAS